jgi:hypothetical protein
VCHGGQGASIALGDHRAGLGVVGVEPLRLLVRSVQFSSVLY